MKTKIQLRPSNANIILIFLCLVILVAILILNSANNGISKNYKSSLNALSEEDSSLVLLRSTYENIVVAENHYRAYLATFDTSQRSLFENSMSHVIGNLERISRNNGSFANNLRAELKGKLKIAETISTLKSMADSLLAQARNGAAGRRSDQPLLMEKLSASFIEKKLSHAVDTVRQVAVARKPGFFKRLFSGKKQDSTVLQYSKGKTQTGSQTDSLTAKEGSDSYETLVDDIKKYYQDMADRQMALRKKLDQNEKILAAANLSIINEISNGIKRLLTTAEELQQQSKAEATASLENFQLRKDRILLISFLTIIAIVALLVIAIFRLNKYEHNIIEAKDRAEKLAQVKTRFLNNMSHEIRVPLTAIMGFAEQLEQTGTAKEAANYISAIRGSSEHLLSTVNDILDFSKLEAGKFTFVKEPFYLRKTLDEVVFSMSVLAKKKGLALKLETDFEEGLMLEGDAFRLKQILYNFIGNAVKFTGHGGVTVTASVDTKSRAEACVHIAVKDTGIGIPADRQEFIFEEFAQVDSRKVSGKYHTRGTGLGLSICKMLAEQQNGTVGVQSEPNKGSVFYAKIPYSTVHLHIRDTKHPKNMTPDKTLLKNKKCLVLEDDGMIAMLVTFLLQKYGIEYDVATDGRTALELFSKNYYDVMLTDINVPELSGLEVASIIREHADPSKSSIPIIALTADVMDEDVKRYQESGITGVLRKPFKENEIIAGLGAALAVSAEELA